MNVEPAISVDHAAKKFAKRLNKSMLYGIQDVARDVVGLSTRPDRLRPEEFWAVDDVSFELKRGDTLGIVGPNGSGKSTLLKMLNGIIYPDRGRLSVRGRVGALIEVGAGFHPMLTGRENIFVNGAILGMSKAEIKGKFDAIVDFAEISEFIDMPVKNYSSGMYVRLGFAVAAHCEPDILLVDEVLAVGDASFRARSFRFIEERVLRRGVIMCLVSHNIHAVTRLCSQALLFDKGAVRYLGDSAGVVKHYYELMRPVCPANGRAARYPETREGAGQVCVERVLLRDRQGKATDSVEAGSPLEVEIHLGVKADVLAMPRVGLKISDLSGVVIVYAFMREERRRSICLKRGRLILRCRFEGFSAMPGRYTMDVKVGGADDLLQDILRDAAVVTVTGSDRLYESTANAGMVYFVNNWDCEQQLR